ncbi:MAG: hypothetical protein MR757_02275 [Proteobacteria bacterium]|nr:hypothetical protein [Pseudomonadota bacterium]
MDEKICGMTKESLRQCLSECGCCCKTADSVIEKIESRDRKGARKILEQKRKEALRASIMSSRKSTGSISSPGRWTRKRSPAGKRNSAAAARFHQ